MIRVLILMLALAGCFASQAAEPPLKVFLLDNGVACVRAASVTDTLTGQLQTELTNQISRLVLDLRFAGGSKNLTGANFLPAQKTPIIVLVNAQAETQFGYSRDELLGQKVTAIIPEGFAERLIADDLRSAAEALAQQIGTGIELTARR